MATLKNAGGTDFGNILTANATLRNLPNGAGTIAALVSRSTGSALDCAGVVTGTGGSATDFFHFLILGTGVSDDDGLATMGTPSLPSTYNADDWAIIAVAWPAGGAAAERLHFKNLTLASAWGHQSTISTNGGNRAGPGSGFMRVGGAGDSTGTGSYGVVGIWAGTQLTDLQVEELSVGSDTSAWWNCTGGQPTCLVELNTTTPTDIGASASTFNSIGTLTLAGGNPPSWTFDGRGAAAPATKLPSFNPIPFMSNQRI